jgi:SAM-dependent methyltransferase
MSAEGPVRKPASEPPDAGSLMSRLDGQEGEGEERLSDPGGERRLAATELLGTRRRSTRRTTRGDEAPTSSSSGLRPSQPPPEPALPSNTSPQELLERTSFVPESARITPQRIINVGGTASYPPPGITMQAAERSPVATAEPTPIGPPVAPLSMSSGAAYPASPPPGVPISVPPAANAPHGEALEPKPQPGPTSDVRLATAAPSEPEVAATPAPIDVGPYEAPPLSNLDAQVKEALSLLEREDFETTIEISVDGAHDDHVAAQDDHVAARDDGPSSEEALDEAALEEVTGPQQGKRGVAAPNPPPRRQPSVPSVAGQPQTLPSAVAPVSQPKIVVAAAATSQTTGSAPIISTPAPSAGQPSQPTADATGEIRKKKRQWFEELFNDDYCRTLPKLDPRYVAREVKFIEEALGIERGATVLDLACGVGEHAVGLASHGYEVIGIDLSLAMLARAADEAAEKAQRINFLQGDMRDLTFEEAFDGIYCWGTSFGYFDDAKNAEVLQKIHRALRRGGRFLLDVANRDFISCRTPSMVWFEGEGCVCMDEAALNAITSRLQVKRTMMMEDGRQREIDYSIRLYGLHELGKLLHECGFRVAEASGDSATPGVFFGSESPRILILAEKR